MVLRTDKPGLVLPEQLHHVEPLGPVQMRVEFYDHKPDLTRA
jgi:hemoglobin